MIIGLVGKPSAGKSTFFRAATLAEADIGNYPFTTIKPNHGVAFVKVEDPAKPFGKVSNPRIGYVLGDYRFVGVDLMDVAGLVPGAHEGHGMGNQFLDDLRQADVLLHIIDSSGATNEKGEEVPAGSYYPGNDVKWLGEELDFWYLGIMKKGWEKFARQLQQEKGEIHVALAKQLSGLNINEDMVKDAIKQIGLNPEQPEYWKEEDLTKLAIALRRESKPMVIVCNKIDVPGAYENYLKMKEEYPHEIFVPCSAESELALREAAKHDLIDYIPGEKNFTLKDESKLNDKQKAALEFIKENVLLKYGTGVQDALDKAIFDLLKFIPLFPGGASKLEDKDGNVIPDCFLMKEGSTALQFAFKIHTDLGNGFIRAIDVKTKRTVGKEHVCHFGDIIEIVSNK